MTWTKALGISCQSEKHWWYQNQSLIRTATKNAKMRGIEVKYLIQGGGCFTDAYNLMVV